MRKIAIKDIRKQDYFYTEAIKTLRTNIQLSGKSIKTIMVSSCFPNEGKSDIVLSIAQELSSIGKKALIIDGDIRKSDFAIRLGVEEEVVGLSQFLSGQGSYLFNQLPEFTYYFRRTDCTEPVRPSQ